MLNEDCVSVFKSDPLCKESWEKLKLALMSEPLLTQPEPHLGDFKIECDASKFAIGMVLMQKKPGSKGYQVCAYESRKLKPKEILTTSIYEKELLAMIHALTKWRVYLEGQDLVNIETDHQSLKWLLSQHELADHQIVWLDFLSRFRLKISYRKGIENFAADALSDKSDLSERQTKMLKST